MVSLFCDSFHGKIRELIVQFIRSPWQIVECLRGGTEGGAILLHFCGAPDHFFVQRNEPFRPQNLYPREGNPLKHRLSNSVDSCHEGEVAAHANAERLPGFAPPPLPHPSLDHGEEVCSTSHSIASNNDL